MASLREIHARRYTVEKEGDGWRVRRRGRPEGVLHTSEDSAWDEADRKADEDYDRATACGASYAD